MNDQPKKPREETAKLQFPDLYDGFLASDCGHCARITINERTRWTTLLGCNQVSCHIRGLLQGHLCQLRMSLRVGFITLNQTLVAYGIHVRHALDAIKTVGQDTPATPDTLNGNALYPVCLYSADPYHGFCMNKIPVFQYQAMVLIVRHSAVGYDFHAKFFQSFLGLTGRFLVHRTQQAWTGIDEIDMHFGSIQVGIVARNNRAPHFC